jgi:hypothetical protein
MTFYSFDNTSKMQGVVLEKTTTKGAVIDLTPIPVWTQEAGPTDPATVVASADGFTADLISGGSPGDTVFLVAYSVGGVPQSAEITVTITAKPDIGEAVFTAGTIVPK